MPSDHQKVALVTGASTGIGRASALALAQAGYITYATARRLESVQPFSQQGLKALRLDVTDEGSMVAAVRQIEAESGAVDVLVNNAGISELGPVEEIPLDRVRLEFETNVFGLIRLSQLVIPGMRHMGGGRIINISSMGGEFTTPFSGIYHASKYAVEAVSDALRFELEPFGIAVIVVQPGVIQTPLGEKTLHIIRSQAQRLDSPYADRLTRYLRFLEDNSKPSEAATLIPEDVARVIMDAVQTQSPQTRYKVGEEAEQLASMRRKLSDREWDAMYRQILG